MNYENIEIRKMIIENNLQMKDVADRMGITDVYLSRIMAKPLSNKNKQRIICAINNAPFDLDGFKKAIKREPTNEQIKELSEMFNISTETTRILKQVIEDYEK